MPAKVEKGDLSPDFVIAAEDIEGEFMTVKDSVQKIRLPPDLKLNETRQGIKREDQLILNLITKSARYIESTLKILGEGVATKALSLMINSIKFLYAKSPIYVIYKTNTPPLS